MNNQWKQFSLYKPLAKYDRHQPDAPMFLVITEGEALDVGKWDAESQEFGLKDEPFKDVSHWYGPIDPPDLSDCCDQPSSTTTGSRETPQNPMDISTVICDGIQIGDSGVTIVPCRKPPYREPVRYEGLTPGSLLPCTDDGRLYIKTLNGLSVIPTGQDLMDDQHAFLEVFDSRERCLEMAMDTTPGDATTDDVIDSAMKMIRFINHGDPNHVDDEDPAKTG